MQHTEQKEQYKCGQCDKIFNRSDNLKRHQLTHLSRSERPTLHCNFCDKISMCKESLRKHINCVHSTTASAHSCTFCSKAFKTSETLNVHIRTHTGEKPYRCSDCSEHFQSRHRLEYHFESIHRARNYNCTQCGKSFSWVTKLKKHMLVHTTKRIHKCPKCDYSCSWKSDLNEHILTHREDLRFKCDICPKVFKLKIYLQKHVSNQHLEINTRVKSEVVALENTYVCQFCKKSFPNITRLNVHIKTHLNERPFTCSNCSNTFKRKGHLDSHFTNVHENRNKKNTRTEAVDDSFKRSLGKYKSPVPQSTIHRLKTPNYFNCRPCVVLLKKLE